MPWCISIQFALFVYCCLKLHDGLHWCVLIFKHKLSLLIMTYCLSVMLKLRLLLMLMAGHKIAKKIWQAKKSPPPVREKGIFWSDVFVFLRPVVLVSVAVLPRLVVIIPLIPTIATFYGQKNNKFVIHLNFFYHENTFKIITNQCINHPFFYHHLRNTWHN